MDKKQLTIAEALKFARHDFSNKLQLVMMHIDLENISEAKKMIFDVTSEMRQESSVELLGLPQTTQWIQTFSWMYPAFQKSLTCTIKPGIREADDVEIVSYLEQIFSRIEHSLDPVTEYDVQIEINASESEWLIKIIIRGALLEQQGSLVSGKSFSVEESVSSNLWSFTLSGQ